MNLLKDLLGFAWVQGLIMLITLKLSLVILRQLSTTKLSERDNLIEIIVCLIFFGVPFISQFFFGITNVFWFSLTFAIIGMACEFLFDFIWFRLMGSRLYRYFKANLLGFTSWFIFPYWAAAGLYFYGAWQFIHFIVGKLGTEILNVVDLGEDLALVAVIVFLILLFLIGIRDYLKGNLSKSSGFQWEKYLLLVLTIWIPILYIFFVTGDWLIMAYFVFTSITGIILEGELSKRLRSLYGESFWLYYRYSILEQGTSLLVLPIWGAASLLALLLMNFFFY